MKFTSGMWLNGKASNNPINTTRKNLNVVLSKNIGSYSVEDGFAAKSASYNATALIPNGEIVLLNNRVCVFSCAGSGSEIGIIEEDGTYTPVSNSAIYNFSVDSPIHGEFYINFNGDTIIAFTDRDRNPPRILNLDAIPNPLTADSILMFPNYIEPSFNVVEIESGGSLVSGAKWITARYIDKEGNKTKWFKTSKPFFITEDYVAEGFDNYDGCAPNTPTTKAVNVSLSVVDTNYARVEFALIEKIDGVVTAKIVNETSVDTTSEIVITGNEIGVAVSMADIFEENASFDRIRAMTTIGNQLYMGNVRETSIDDYQKWANNIRLNVVSKKLNQSNFTGSCKTKNGYGEMSFKHSEVMAFYFHFIMNDGSRSRGFLISGRAAATGTIKVDSSSYMLIADERIRCRDAYNSGINLGVNLSYLLEDLAIDPEVKYFHTRDTSYNPNATTNFGFFENETEEYPNTDDFLVYDANGQIGDLRGEKVRHHKFPSIQKIKETFYPNDPTYGGEFLDVLGIEIDPNSLYIPQEILDKIQGWEISYAERTPQNASILGQDLLMFGCNHGVGTPVRSNGGNWNTLNLSNSQTQDILRDEARFHSFDIIRYKPSTVPSYIRNNLKMVKQCELYDVQGTYVANQYNAVLVSDFGHEDHYTQSSGNNYIETPILRDVIRKITNYKFVPNNVVDGSLDNRYLEEFIHANITSAQGIPLNTSNRSYYHSGYSPSNNTRQSISINSTSVLFGAVEETFLTDICVLYKDMYTSFYNQKLVSTGHKFTKGTSVSGVKVFGGDVFIGFHSFVAFGTRDQWDYSDSRKGIKAFKRFLCESFSNTEMRWYDSTSTDRTYYYPFGGTLGLFVNIGYGYYRDLEPNQFLYNKDYSSIDNMCVLIPYNPTETFVTEHKNRVYRSLEFGEEEQVNNWKTVKINDYYEMPKNLGEIVALQGYGDRLIINQIQASSITIGNEKLPTTQGEVNLGTGDIFRVKPEQFVVDKYGYVGVQHKYGTCLCKYGYVMLDAEHGKVFIYRQGEAIRELSKENSLALHDFFRDESSGVNDNPYNGSGFSMAFDEKYERLIIVKKKYELNSTGTALVASSDPNLYLRFVSNRWVYVNVSTGIYQIVYEGDERFWDSVSWTVSYSFDFNCWASFHSYTPDRIFNTRNYLLSFKNANIYEHNKQNKCIFYDEAVIESSYITPTFVSPYRTQEKALISALYGSVTMNTEMYDPDGVLIKDETVSRVLAWNSYQSTGDIDVVLYNENQTLEQNFGVFNVNNAKNSFTFNKLRDHVANRKLPFIEDYESIDSNIDFNKPFYMRRKLIDKYLIVKLLYNNRKISNLQYDFHFGDISVYTKIATR